MLRTTNYAITDKTDHSSGVTVYYWRASTNDAWQRQPNPIVTTPVWGISVTRKQAADVLKAARRNHPVWQVAIKKSVTES